MALKAIPPRLKRAPPRLKPVDMAGGFNRSHYQSPEHRAWAAAVKERDGYRCVLCGAGREKTLIADHVVEIVDGGERLDIANGQTLCAACSNRKTAEARSERLMG